MLAIAMVFGGSGAPVVARSVTEAQAKAALLYNFVAFVDWPQAAIDARTTFVIGVAGDADVLDALHPIAGQTLKGHPIAIRDVREDEDPTQCHVLYFPATRDRTTASLLHRAVDAPVLTVGDSTDFSKRGGIVTVYFDQSRLRFDVNLANAHRAQLKISSKALGLARAVKSDGTTE